MTRAPGFPFRAAAFAIPLGLAGCELAEVEIQPAPDLVVAGVTVVLTVDPVDPSQVGTHILALITLNRRQESHEVPGASVWVTGESGRSLELREESDPLTSCATQLSGDYTRPPVGSCYTATASSTFFTPRETLSVLVTLADGGVLHGVSRVPGIFAPSGLSLDEGRCRLEPDTNHRFAWPPSDGARAYVVEAEIEGLDPELWWSEEPLHLPLTLIGGGAAEVVFPRDLLSLFEVDDRELARALETGLPTGTTADIAVGAVDRNWANWIRIGRITPGGPVLVPSVFGDGTGMFGTAVRWKVSVESRFGADAGGELPLCGPPVAD